MKIKYLKLKNWLLAALGGLLGINLSGCIPACEYGTPEGEYHVKGVVTNSKGDPIEGIGVNQIYSYGSDGTVVPDMRFSDTTGPDGRYSIRMKALPNEKVDVGFVDLDGPEHGLYHDTVIAVSAPRSEFHGGDGWYEGTADINLDVVLQPVEPSE